MTHPAPAGDDAALPGLPSAAEPDRTEAPDREGAGWLRLLPAVLDDDPDEAAVTDALLDTVDLAGDLQALVDALADLLEHASSAGTRRAYATDWADFTDWTGRHRLLALPAEPRTVALYVTAQQDRLRPVTLLRRLSAIAVTHRTADQASPTGHELVRRAVAGLRRKHGARPAGKTALVTAPLVTICGRLHDRESAAAQLAAHLDALSDQPGAAAERRRAAGRLRVARAAALRARRDRALQRGLAAIGWLTPINAVRVSGLVKAGVVPGVARRVARVQRVGAGNGRPVARCSPRALHDGIARPG